MLIPRSDEGISRLIGVSNTKVNQIGDSEGGPDGRSGARWLEEVALNAVWLKDLSVHRLRTIKPLHRIFFAAPLTRAKPILKVEIGFVADFERDKIHVLQFSRCCLSRSDYSVNLVRFCVSKIKAECDKSIRGKSIQDLKVAGPEYQSCRLGNCPDRLGPGWE